LPVTISTSNYLSILNWDKEPYIPYTSFAMLPGNSHGINDFHFWLDNDASELQDPEYVDSLMDEITKNNGTYTILMMKGIPPDNDASRLFDKEVKKQIIDSWKPFISAIKKEGLRSLILWNEIDIEFHWPDVYTTEEYGSMLHEYAVEMKKLVGDIPVLFKTTVHVEDEGYNSYKAVIAAAAETDGLGLDSYPPTCPHESSAYISDYVTELEQRRDKESLVWMTEFGKGGREEDECYWDGYPPFESREEMKCQMETFIQNGATGFIYAGPAPGALTEGCSHLDYSDSHSWFFEMRDEIIQKIINGE